MAKQYSNIQKYIVSILIIFMVCFPAQSEPYLQPVVGGIVRDMTYLDPDPDTDDDEQLLLLVQTTASQIGYGNDEECVKDLADICVMQSVAEGRLYLVRVNLVNNEIVDYTLASTDDVDPESDGALRFDHLVEMVVIEESVYVLGSTRKNGIVVQVFRLSNTNGESQLTLLESDTFIGLDDPDETDEKSESLTMVMTSVDIQQTAEQSSEMTLLVDWRDVKGDGRSATGRFEQTRMYKYNITHPGDSYLQGDRYVFDQQAEKFILLSAQKVNSVDLSSATLPVYNFPVATRSVDVVRDEAGNLYSFQGTEQVHHGNYLLDNDRSSSSVAPNLTEGVAVYSQDTDTNRDASDDNFESEVAGLLDGKAWWEIRRVTGIRCPINFPNYFKDSCELNFNQNSFQFNNDDDDHYHYMRTLLKVPEAGDYTFVLSGANDFVRLVVGDDIGRALVNKNNDSVASENTYQLHKGFNELYIEHFDTNDGSHAFSLQIYEGTGTSGTLIFEQITIEPKGGDGQYEVGEGFIQDNYLELGYGLFVPQFINYGFKVQYGELPSDYDYRIFGNNFSNAEDNQDLADVFRANDYFRANLDIEPNNDARTLLIKRNSQLDSSTDNIKAFAEEMPEKALFANDRIYLASRFITEKETDAQGEQDLKTLGRGIKISALQTNGLSKVKRDVSDADSLALEASVVLPDSQHYYGRVMTFEEDSAGNIYIVASLGHVDDQIQSVDASFFNGNGAAFAQNVSSNGASFFIGKLDSSLTWQWVTFPEEFNSDLLPDTQDSRNVPFLNMPITFSDNDQIAYLGGFINEGRISLQNQGDLAVSAVIETNETDPIRGFISAVETSTGEWLDLESLTIESGFEDGVDFIGFDDLVLPAIGSQQVANGETVDISAPKLFYVDESGNVLRDENDLLLDSDADGNDVRAVTRYRCTGIEVNLVRVDTDTCATSIVFEQKTLVQIKWQVEHLISINNDFQNKNITQATPNPVLAAARHWLIQGESVTLSVDGAVRLASAPGQRELLYDINLIGPGTLPQVVLDPSEQRQQPLSFVVSDRLDVTYRWKTQFSANINVNNSTYTDAPKLLVVSRSRDGAVTTTLIEDGSGNYWIDQDSEVNLLVPANQGFGGLDGYTNGSGLPPSFGLNGSLEVLELGCLKNDDNQPELKFVADNTQCVNEPELYNLNISALDQPFGLQWLYDVLTLEMDIDLGQSVSLEEVITHEQNKKDVPENLLNTLRSNGRLFANAVTGSVIFGPDSSTIQNMIRWAAFEQRFYPLRPGKTSLEFEEGDFDDPLERQIFRVEITATWPDEYDYTYIIDTPGIELDSRSDDYWAFAELGYTDVSAQSLLSQDGKFSFANSDDLDPDSSEVGKSSLLLFTCTEKNLAADATAVVATGDLETEPVCARTVKMQNISRVSFSDTVDDTDPIIGEVLLDEELHNAPHSGYVVNPLARYNPNIYSRQNLTGPIIPVNQQFMGSQDHDFVVLWYKNRDASQIKESGVWEPVYWPNKAIRYEPRWPEKGSANRIVVASRLGSEGSDFSQNSQGEHVNSQTVFSVDEFANLRVYNQPDKSKAGFNPNEEHGFLDDSFNISTPRLTAAFALRNDLNITSTDKNYTSDSYVLVEYLHIAQEGEEEVENDWRMLVYEVQMQDDKSFHLRDGVPQSDQPYTFNYRMTAGEPVVAPYPLNMLQGIQIPAQNWGHQSTNPQQNVYWTDFNGKAYAISGGTELFSYQWYPMRSDFWWPDDMALCYDNAVPMDFKPRRYKLQRADIEDSDCSLIEVGSLLPLGSSQSGNFEEVEITYRTQWPQTTPVLKAGETLTFSGGEAREDNAENDGLPGILGYKSGELVFDSSNPLYGVLIETNSPPADVRRQYAARVAQVLEKRTVDWPEDGPDLGEWLSSGKIRLERGKYFFTELPVSLQSRVYIDSLTQQLEVIGFLDGKTLGDSTLTAAPGAIYALQPNILSATDLNILQALCDDGSCGTTNDSVLTALTDLYNKSRVPGQECEGPITQPLTTDGSESTYSVGLCNLATTKRYKHTTAFGPGLAVIPNDALLDPGFDNGQPIYITIAENNHALAGGSPVSLSIIEIQPQNKFRGEIAVLLPPNVFDEKVNLRHTADFGANGEDMVFEWYYRADDGGFNDIAADLPFGNGVDENGWTFFATPNQGLGQNEINLSGNSAALLADNLFLTRYRHADCDPAENTTCWSQWAGAADNNPAQDIYRPQLAQGWVKRVIDRVNAFEARVNDFYSSDSPATYSSMIQQAGQAYNGPVALNNDQDVIENTGLIQLYETVLQRALNLSVNASQPYTDDAVYTALQLVSSRLAQLYTLLGNEAYVDALDPTIGFTTNSDEYGSLAPSIYSFENQMPSLIEEELSLLRGRSRSGASPAYNRLLWNFTLGEGEVAYAQNYNISDVNESGIIDVVDARTLYPQGHGDAWGHYTQALSYFYNLLKNPNFQWVASAENVALDGLAVEVDFEDERRFAEIAAARAKTGHDIVNLTFRQQYIEDPNGQWQGYKDRDTARAWGVTGWSQRAATGAYMDWLLANAILPAEAESSDDEAESLFVINRENVPDVSLIASQAEAIYAMLDASDAGKNPLGILPDAVPFDIDPVLLDRDSELAATHFEQIATRAEQAVSNAFKVFDNANQQKNRIREVADSAEDLFEQAIDQDLDFRNRLIEIFGTPHPGNIGSGKIYPAGYDGPDLYFYPYVDTTDIVNEDAGAGYQGDVDGQTFDSEFNAFLNLPVPGVGDVDLSADRLSQFNLLISAVADEDPLTLTYPQDASDYGFVAPDEWGQRLVTGKIQQALTELVKAEADLTLTIIDYNGLIFELDNAVTEIEAFNALNAELNIIREDNKDTVTFINAAKAVFQTTAALTSNSIDLLRDYRDAFLESFPKTNGTSNDTTFVGRSTLSVSYAATTAVLAASGTAAELGAAALEAEEEVNELKFEIDIANTEEEFELQQMLREAEYILDDEEPRRISMFRARETMRQAAEAFRNVLSEGLRLLEEREVFNKRLAVKAQEDRYQDMTFRIGQYEALQKYRSAFDLAARYIYLAARVYDYETNLSETDPRSAQAFMSQIVKERVLGLQATQGAVSGEGGLSELLSTMQLNFGTLKSQMGFNNPQTETGRFSLRYELARITNDPDIETDDQDWRNWLEEHKVDNLWNVPEYRRFARNFAPERAGPQPALVIPFESTIQFGKNFFNLDLSGGDHAYDATNFATKIRSVGVWFENYNNSSLAETPRVYLIPAGTDFMYVPTSAELDVREWQVIDQRIPVPLPLTTSSLEKRNFLPVEDTLTGDFGETRRISSFRAYHDGGQFDDNETHSDSRLIGRSVWNNRWLLIIPGQTFLADPENGLNSFIHGNTIPSSDAQAQRDGQGISDIRLFFQTYSYSGN